MIIKALFNTSVIMSIISFIYWIIGDTKICSYMLIAANMVFILIVIIDIFRRR